MFHHARDSNVSSREEACDVSNYSLHHRRVLQFIGQVTIENMTFATVLSGRSNMSTMVVDVMMMVKLDLC